MAPPSVYDKIGCITKELIKDGTINKHHERHLKERLSFLCKDSPRAPPSNGHRYSRKEITAFSKLKTARKVYMRVLQDNAPLFLPLLLAVAPGSWHKVKDKELAKLTEQRNIHLKASAKEYLEKISQNEGFATSDNFRRILEALFPKVPDYAPITTTAEGATESFDAPPTTTAEGATESFDAPPTTTAEGATESFDAPPTTTAEGATESFDAPPTTTAEGATESFDVLPTAEGAKKGYYAYYAAHMEAVTSVCGHDASHAVRQRHTTESQQGDPKMTEFVRMRLPAQKHEDSMIYLDVGSALELARTIFPQTQKVTFPTNAVMPLEGCGEQGDHNASRLSGLCTSASRPTSRYQTDPTIVDCGYFTLIGAHCTALFSP